MNIMKLEKIKKTYSSGENAVQALKGINLEINENDFISIIGPSGSGKSTLMNLIGCLDIPTSGLLTFKGNSIEKMSDNELSTIRNKHLGFVFQNFNLLMKHSCLHNVETPLIYRGLTKSDRIKKSSEMLRKVGLGDKIHKKPYELSGGQKQRVAIARALVTDPDIILADEPTGALDTKTSEEIMSILVKLNNEGKSIILVTHEDDIANYAHKIIKIRDGLIEDIKILGN